MFEYLIHIEPRLYDRYLTVERNIKSASNSFYDSYLDMQEQFVKTVILAAGIDFKPNETCGALLKKPDVVALFSDTLGVDDYTFHKMQDYTLKVNAHKHKGEKKIAVDTIVSYLRVFYTATAAYGKSKGIECEEFNADEIIRIFDLYDRENQSLRKKQDSLREELSRMADVGALKTTDVTYLHGLLSPDEMDRLSVEDQNSALYRQISGLMEIKLSSMEDKLNRTIELLLELKPVIAENRVITKAVGNCVGSMINGDTQAVEHWLEKAQSEGGEN